MSETLHSLHPEDLARHSAWIRALARSLVRDEAAAEDLVQETWLTALRRQPSSDRSLRPWLAQVTRYLAARHRERQRARAASSLSDETAAPETSPAATLDALEQQRLLVELVQALPEPLRTTVVLRYTHGLTSAEIGQRMEAPAGTVRWRLKEALGQLRVELDQRFGGREEGRAWATLLLPLFQEHEAATLAGKSLVGKGLVASATRALAPSGLLAAGLAAVVLSVFLVRDALERSDRASAATLSARGADSAQAAGEREVSSVATAMREPQLPVPPEAAPRTPATVAVANPDSSNPTLGRVVGRVVDQVGRVLGPGLLVLRPEGVAGQEEDLEVELASDGTWSAEKLPPGDYLLGALALPEGYLPAWDQFGRASRSALSEPRGPVSTPKYRPTRVRVVLDATPTEVELVVYRAARLEGVLYGADGRALAGAHVRARGAELEYINMLGDGTTDEHGGYRIEDLWPGSYELIVYAPSSAGSTREAQAEFPLVGLLPGDSAWQDLELGRGNALVRGRVLDEEGAPFAGLQVLCFRKPGNWSHSTGTVVTDAEGRFELGGLLPHAYGLVIGHAGFRIGAKRGENVLARWAAPVEFEITDPGASLELPTVTAIRSRPFELKGVLHLSGAAELRDFSLAVQWEEVSRFSPTGEPQARQETIELAKDGTFSWWCETPHPEVELRVLAKRQGHAPRWIHIVPERGGQRELSLRY